MDKARLRRIAKYQRAVCVCILLMFGMIGYSLFFNPGASWTYNWHWIALLYYLISLVSPVFTYILVRNIYNPTVAALLAIFMLVPVNFGCGCIWPSDFLLQFSESDKFFIPFSPSNFAKHTLAHAKPIAFTAILMLVLCVNILILLAASLIAIKVLKAENIKVGFVGANMSQFD